MCSNRIWQVALFLAISFFVTGCGGGGGPELGQIKGRVQLDGMPVSEATVLFQQDASPSAYGVTDSDGYYEVMFSEGNPGAVLGQHRVTIGTARFRDGINHPETIPAMYNRESKLTREVVAGQQTFDFDIKTE